MTARLPDDCIVALAGRRVGANDDSESFPPANVPAVRAKILQKLTALPTRGLVCSAACGADLLALDAACSAKIPYHVVLPFSTPQFRDKSVTDRSDPGYWGGLYDRLVVDAEHQCELTELAGAGSDDEAFARANGRIIEYASAWAAQDAVGGPMRRVALLVWEGAARPNGDTTAKFGKLAKAAGFECETILTLTT